MRIRKATKKDLEKLYTLFVQFKDELRGHVKPHQRWQRRRYKSAAITKKALIKKLENKKGLYYVVEDKGELVGMAYGEVRTWEHPVFKDVTFGEIQHAYTIKEYRGKGIATKLKNKLLPFFKKHKCKYLELFILGDNPAKSLYKKWGFKPYIEIMRKD